jgi:hypothetical protein
MTDTTGPRSPSAGERTAAGVPQVTPDANSAPAAGPADYRSTLRSRRWDAAPLANPEVERTDPRIAVAFIAAISVVTFVLLVLGYATGFWG